MRWSVHRQFDSQWSYIVFVSPKKVIIINVPLIGNFTIIYSNCARLLFLASIWENSCLQERVYVHIIYGEFEGIIAIISIEYIFIKCLISEDPSLVNTAYDTCS
jgi:hypothetical protein